MVAMVTRPSIPYAEIQMKRFWFLLLSLFSGAAFADATVTSQTKVHSFLTPDMLTNDVSLNVLSQVFGTVGNVIHGSSGQFVGQLFYKLNQGFCVVAGLWLFYTIASTIFKASQEGSLMGQNRNTFWIFLRISIGIGLLLPMPLTGYSVFQGTVMSVVTQGVGLADQTWSWVLDSLKNGGKIYTDPKQIQLPADDFKQGDIVGRIQEIAAAEACYYFERPVVEGDSSLAALAGSSNIIWTEDKAGNFFFAKGSTPGECGSVHWAAGISSDNVPQIIDPNNNYEDVAQQSANGDATNRLILRGLTQRAATLQVINDLQPAVKQWVLAAKAPASSTGGAVSSLPDTMLAAAIANSVTDYMSLTLPVRRLLQQQTANDALSFIDKAKKEGWLMAGRYYWDLVDSGIKTNDPSGFSGILFETTPKSSEKGSADIKKILEPVGSDKTCSSTSTSLSCATYNALHSLYENQNHGRGSPDIGGFGDRSTGGSLIESIILGAFLPFLGGLVSLLSSFQDVGADPMIFLHNIGTGCISTMISIWLMGAVYSAVMAIPGMVCSAVQPIGWVVQALGDWIRPIAFGCTGLLIIAGIILGYYAPLYPWMVFTFATLGWIISVIEAMVAAPLVSLGLTHPEGHDFLGKVEQALMLLLGVFLRPVLMVVGLLISMILCYVILRVVNYGFIGIIQSAFPTPTFNGDLYGAVNNVAFTQAAASIIKSGALAGVINPFTGIINLVGQALIFPLVVIGCLLVLYAGLVFNLINQIFTLIYVLPDKIMRWVGTPQEHSDVASGVQQSRGTLGSSTGFIHGGQATSAADAIGNAVRKKNSDEENDEASNLSGGSATRSGESSRSEGNSSGDDTGGVGGNAGNVGAGAAPAAATPRAATSQPPLVMPPTAPGAGAPGNPAVGL